MSQEKAQLIAPIDSSFTVPGVTVSGVITATSFDGTITGVADSITQGKNLNVGVITALSFAGNLTGDAGGLIGSPNTVAGVVTGTSFVGGLTGNITGDVIGNATGVGASIKQGTNLNVGIATAWKWYGDGSGLTGLGGTSWVAQEVTASSAETIIDLTYGNLVYLSQSSNTTVGFASTAATQEISIVRNTDSSNTITWPDRITWNGGITPTLVNNPRATAVQVFRLLSVDSGLTYSGWEEMKGEPPYKLWSWGDNSYGSLGQNSRTNYSSPVQIPGTAWDKDALDKINKWASRAASSAFKTDGTLWVWGLNSYGQLGHNNTTSYSSPVQLSGTTWAQFGQGDNVSLATKTDGTLWVWGNNHSGGLGLNQTTTPSAVRIYYSSPVQVGTDTTWGTGAGKVVSGQYECGAIKTDGTLWVWGQNENGLLGLNQPYLSDRSSPVQVPGTTWNRFSQSYGSRCATKTDGSLWKWGQNHRGEVGTNDILSRSSPTQIPGTWSHISIKNFTIGVKTDGTLWSWGSNSYGNLGHNNSHPTGGTCSSPTQVGSGTDWSKSICSNVHVAAIKTDGTVWAWGSNSNGRLGQNENPSDRYGYSSPVQVPGTWDSLAAFGLGTGAFKV